MCFEENPIFLQKPISKETAVAQKDDWQSDKQNAGSKGALNTCMFNSQCLNVVLLFIYSLSARMCGSQGHLENTMKYARIKDLCIETCFLKKDRRC